MANITSNMLGKDCQRYEYWHFKEDSERIYIRTDQQKWQYLDEEQSFDQLIESLNPKGIREKKLIEGLKKCKERLKLKKSKKGDVDMSVEIVEASLKVIFEESNAEECKSYAIWFGKKIPNRRRQQ